MPCEAGDPGWRGRLISHAPRLGRPEVNGSLLPPVYAARHLCPADAWQRWRAAPNRGYHLPARSAAPRTAAHSAGERWVAQGYQRRWAIGGLPIRQRDREKERGRRYRRVQAHPAGRGESGGRRVRPSAARRAPEGVWPCKWRQHRQSIDGGDTGRGGRLSVESLPPPQL